MVVFLFLLLLCSRFSAHAASLTPMKIAVVSGYGSLVPEMQFELQNSLKWIQSSIQVYESAFSVEIDAIYERIPEYQKFSTVLIQTPTHRQNIKFEEITTLLKLAEFTIFVVAQDPRKCARDPDLLAEALPIILVPDTRPSLATMSICLQNNPRHRNRNIDSRFFYDLFRHEILHGLGYGLIIDKSGLTEKPSEKYLWFSANGVGNPGSRHFLDFDSFAITSARSHFDCNKMKGIVADGERKNHLNDYIFGNELMTTHLEPSGNIFSWISVGIIERTFNGKEQWYYVNRTFIAPEANQYTYGKKFGCDFLQKSCHDFIRLTETTRLNMTIAPFCSKHQRRICYKLPMSENVFRVNDMTCEMRRVNGDNTVINNGRQQRQCPYIKQLPPNFEIVQCSPRSG